MSQKEGQIVSDELVHNMLETGKQRASSGRLLPIQAIREIYLKDPVRAHEYLYGYMSSVQEALSNNGIKDPDQLDIHESFTHVVIQDPKLEGTAGMEGLNDGMEAVESSQLYSGVGASMSTHYNDGYKIGVEYTKTLARKGIFEPLTYEEEIPKYLRNMLSAEIVKWLQEKNLESINSDVILHLTPFSRIGFGEYFKYNGNLDLFVSDLTHRQITNAKLSQEQRDKNIDAARKGFIFARDRINAAESIHIRERIND